MQVRDERRTRAEAEADGEAVRVAAAHAHVHVEGAEGGGGAEETAELLHAVLAEAVVRDVEGREREAGGEGVGEGVEVRASGWCVLVFGGACWQSVAC
jgi:hypothetical protein